MSQGNALGPLSAPLTGAGHRSLVAARPEGLLGAFVCALMLAIAPTNLDYYFVPNELTGMIAGLALVRAGTVGSQAGLPDAGWTLCSGVAPVLPFALMIGYRRLRGPDGRGFGDVKLAAVTGISTSPLL